MPAASYCDFPGYLWRPLASGVRRRWVTRPTYAGVTRQWTQRREVFVRRSEIKMTHVRVAGCASTSNVTSRDCRKPRTAHKFVCISEEANDTFRVQLKRAK